MKAVNPKELHVSIDVGCYFHSVAVGLANGTYLGKFEISHNKSGFQNFFKRIEEYKKQSNGEVSVAMEGYNGHARPLDKMVQAKNYKLLNINNLKLARFKEIFPAPAKTDVIDSRKGLELFQLQQIIPAAKNVLQKVYESPQENIELKCVTRKRKRLVNERTRYLNSLHADLTSVSPGLVDITGKMKNVWFMNFLASSKKLSQLANKSKKTLLNIPWVGQTKVKKILVWQKQAVFSKDEPFMSSLIHLDIARINELGTLISQLDKRVLELNEKSNIAKRLISIKGFGVSSCGELAGEIGNIQRFKKEASLAVYLGMAPLDNNSGNSTGIKKSKNVNSHAKAAMMSAVDKHRIYIEESKLYYEKKRNEGKKHNQAIRSLGRHMVRVVFKMLTLDRDYQIVIPIKKGEP
ncbi:MAG: IS110 family transposase [Marinicellaceae bacterium]